MRWKLLFAVSVVGGLVGVTLWSGLVVGIFGSARVMAQENWRLLGSLVVPLAVTVLAAIFVYRHTSRRRKLQSMLTAAFVVIITALLYLVTSQILPVRLVIPRTSDVRRAR